MRWLPSTAVAAFALVSVAAPANAFFNFELQSQRPVQSQRATSVSLDTEMGVQQPVIPRQVVDYTGPYGPGTVIVNTSERRLYYVMPGGKAVRYGVGVGRAGFEWAGTKTITQKQQWPDWRPPEDMLKRRPDLPRYMAGGPHNPLGARAMYLGDSLYRIHGSNEPDTIGQAVSSGCIRMHNADVVDLYERVQVGTRVVVLR